MAVLANPRAGKHRVGSRPHRRKDGDDATANVIVGRTDLLNLRIQIGCADSGDNVHEGDGDPSDDSGPVCGGG